ncbi:methyltransferase [Aquibacillus kalidii]|uniref:methyltransferase n=1 Tax=Aquibacillus kalidii TaxID=2762597 RepID=UPI0016471051|nr:methyltransferase [Aquibacillus kalidii]
MKEHFYDKLLNIHTTKEQKGFNQSDHYHRYEATPYAALEHLFADYQVNHIDRFVDFGCGKGRLNFFIHYHYDLMVTGVEMNQIYYKEAIKNKYRYSEQITGRKNDTLFFNGFAQDYPVNKLDNRFYFFNPFSVQIFMTVINKILYSVEQHNREVELILYYPSDEYVYYLSYQTSFQLIKEITLPEYDRNPYERFLIFRLVSH